MEAAESGDAWSEAAWRLRGLAASFGAVRLMTLAGEAAAAARPDRVLLGRLKRIVSRL